MQNIKKVLSLFFGFLSVFISGLLPAQSIYEQLGRLPVTAYSPEEYEGYPLVWTAIQSREGLMYFGTGLGLQEYDGVTWRSLFKSHEEIAIRSLVEDNKGRIFYGGYGFGYLETNQRGEKRPISLLHLIPEELRADFLVYEIRLQDEYIYLRCRDKHILRLEIDENFKLKSYKSWEAETRYWRSYLVGDAFYVYQFQRGLYKVEDDEIALVPGTEFFENSSVATILSHPNGKQNDLLIGSSESGFYFLEEGILSRFQTEADNLIKEGNRLSSMIPHQGNYIVALFGGGIVILTPEGKIFKRINTDQGLPTDAVTYLYLDSSNGLWATTENGIARILIDSPILSFGKESGVTTGVQSIQKVEDVIYLGTSSGLVNFDSNEKYFKTNPLISSGQIFDIALDKNDLIVPFLQKLQVIRDGKTILLDVPELGTSFFSAYIPKYNPDLLLVGSTSGMLIYARGLNKEFPWEYKGIMPLSGSASHIFEGKDGLIFSAGGGKLQVIDIKQSRLESLNSQSFKSIVFEFNNSDMYSLIDDELYVKSSNGMQKFSTSDKKFIPTEDFSEVEKEMIDFTQFKSGILWYESKNKKKYILKRNSVGKFVKDERPNSIGPYLSYVDYIDEDSIFWFGSEKGLIRYDPKKDQQTDKKFFTLIRRIETKTDTIPLPFYGRNKVLASIERKENSYRFEFAAPYFEEEKKTKYQTFLEGFDPDWVDWNDNKFKEYTNLPAGNYTFHVRAQAFTGRVSEEAVYSFVVLAPWYATWWAYLIYALLIGGIVTGIVKWRSRKLKAENRILEERVNERTAALEKSLADLKSTQSQLIHAEKMASLGELTAGIAHEIQNPLNFVNNFSEVSEELIEEMNEEIDRGNYDDAKAISADLKDNLNKIKFHGKRADGIVKSMLQHSRKDSGKKEMTDINQLADEYLRLSYHGLRAKDKSFFADFHLDPDPTLPRVEVIPQEIGRVFLNLINNAFYAASERKKLLEASGNLEDFKPKVWVVTKNVPNGINISIRDNGNGIPDDIKSKIFQPFFTTKPAGSGTGLGLSMSYDIITKGHQGTLEVESKQGEYTEFTIFLNTNKS